MAELKTQPSNDSVMSFLDTIEDPRKYTDSITILKLMKEVTGESPTMWGESMIGFGQYHYKYASGREGDWFLTGFSPRKNNFSLYIMAGFDQYESLLARLGKHKKGKSCLYIRNTDDVDLEVLRELVTASVQYIRDIYNA